jgi:hypothetical protein
MEHTSPERVPRSSGVELKTGEFHGVFARLVEEHRELTAQLLRLRLSADPVLRAELYPSLRDDLLAHEHAEANVLYLAMSKKEQTRLIAAKHRRTGNEIEKLVARLSALDYAHANWEPTFALLFEAFEQHTIEEESYYFPIAQRVLGEAKAQLMSAHYEAARGPSAARSQ